MATWQDNPDLMERLSKVQNTKTFRHQDILSFAGVCSNRAELLKHVERCEQRAGVKPLDSATAWAVEYYAKAGRFDLVKGLVA